MDLAALELSKTTITFKRWAATHYAQPEVAHWWKAFDALSRAKQVLGVVPPPPSGNDIIWRTRRGSIRWTPGIASGSGGRAGATAPP